MQSRFNLFVAVVVLLAITISASVFFVDERERVISKFRLLTKCVVSMVVF